MKRFASTVNLRSVRKPGMSVEHVPCLDKRRVLAVFHLHTQRRMFGKLVHLGIDAILVSALLAGVRRSTGLTPALSQVPNKDVRQFLRTYLEFGEYAFDFAVVVFGRSKSFERK